MVVTGGGGGGGGERERWLGAGSFKSAFCPDDCDRVHTCIRTYALYGCA